MEKKSKWINDIIICIEQIDNNRFTLDDMYQFEGELKIKHPNNNNIQEKIRQQLQLLRDMDYLIFEGDGKYKKIIGKK